MVVISRFLIYYLIITILQLKFKMGNGLTFLPSPAAFLAPRTRDSELDPEARPARGQLRHTEAGLASVKRNRS
jgi:hypothetical protein